MAQDLRPEEAAVSELADLRPGDLGFGPIHGGAGLLVSAGQLLLGEGFRVGDLDIRHVFVVVESLLTTGPAMKVVEAMPGGAREAWVGADRWTDQYAYIRLPEDYPGQADDATAIARAMIGTPYSFASYAALAAWRLGMKTPKLERWIDRRRNDGLGIQDPEVRARIIANYKQQGIGAAVGLPREAICSVLADQAWSLTGKKIMEGVAHQCVTPGALAGRLLAMDGAHWMWPGRG
jgi:hypothetical protein